MTFMVVDTSYVVFAKYYSTMSWYRKYVNGNPDIPSITENRGFLDKFQNGFEACMRKLCARFGVPPHLVIYAKDCSKTSVWRRAVYPPYKEARVHNAQFNRDIFRFMYSSVLPAFISKHGGVIIENESSEADDIIAVCKTCISGELIIISNDNDCIQLEDKNTRVYNLMLHDIGRRKGELRPMQYLRSRIISGDRSDCIPSILSRHGMKTAARLVLTLGDEQLMRFVEDHGARESFERNSLLMDLTKIPAEMQEAVRGKVVEYLRTVDHASR